MNSYKKTLLASGIALLAFQACYATAEFDSLKSQLNTAFKDMFDPAPNRLSFRMLMADDTPRKLADFYAVIKRIEQFVKINNKGLILGASTTLEQANKALVIGSAKLLSTLGEMRKRLKATRDFSPEEWASQSEVTRGKTGAIQLHIELVNLRDSIKPIRDTLRTKVDDYKSTGQKESYALLIDALQDIHDAIEIIRFNFVEGKWLKVDGIKL